MLDRQNHAEFADEIETAWDLAATLHQGQRVPGSDLPYLTHLGMVTFEVFAAHAVEPLADIRLAILSAILHDSVEDQKASLDLIARLFGVEVASGVAALSKDPSLPKLEAMRDSLARIESQPKAIWCVKLADRIRNLHGAPAHWSPAKITAYRAEAVLILDTLGAAHGLLAARLAARIEAYP